SISREVHGAFEAVPFALFPCGSAMICSRRDAGTRRRKGFLRFARERGLRRHLCASAPLREPPFPFFFAPRANLGRSERASCLKLGRPSPAIKGQVRAYGSSPA